MNRSSIPSNPLEEKITEKAVSGLAKEYEDLYKDLRIRAAHVCINGGASLDTINALISEAALLLPYLQPKTANLTRAVITGLIDARDNLVLVEDEAPSIKFNAN